MSEKDYPPKILSQNKKHTKQHISPLICLFYMLSNVIKNLVQLIIQIVHCPQGLPQQFYCNINKRL